VGADLVDAYGGPQLVAFVRSGIALDITEEMASRGIMVDDFWPALRPVIMLEDRMYGIPRNANAPAIWYNKDLFDQAGIPYPQSGWTWEEFISTAAAFNERDAKGRPVRFGFSSSKLAFEYMGEVVLQLWGAHWYSPERTTAALDSPEGAAALQFMQDLIYKYRIMPTPIEEASMTNAGGWGMGGGLTQFGAGQAAMAMGGRWWLCMLRADYDIRVGAVEIPHDPEAYIPGGGAAVVVNRHSDHIEGALAFLEYLHGPAYNLLTNRVADAVAPVREYSYTEDYEHNPDYPEEDFHAVFRAALERAEPTETSPYVNGQRVTKLYAAQCDLLRLNKKTGAEVARDLTRQINATIVEQLNVDPTLRERYYEAVAAGAPKAWTREEDAP
jgi:multiple sugar transport system substrate-binding protein